jgi:glycine hydroxymethyltransferase
MYTLKKLLGKQFDEINSIIDLEMGIMKNNIILIGSANFPFPSVMDALSFPFQYNPAEGIVGKRYFPKCESIDSLEIYGSRLLQKILNDTNEEYLTTFQPHSGTQANQIVYNAILDPGDCVISMSSKAGGHVSHNNFLRKYFNLKQFELNNENKIDFDKLDSICKYEKPKLLIVGASSYPYEIDYNKLNVICEKYGIYLLADISHTFNYIASNFHCSPIEHADFITFTTHKTTRGIRGGILMFKKKFSSQINPSIFPVTQGAPKYNEILAKIVMLVELDNMDIKKYCEACTWYSNTFIQYFNSRGIETTTNKSDVHYAILDLSNHNIDGKTAETRLANINILVNRNMIPNDKRGSLTTSGVRVGFLTLATLEFSKNDFFQLLQIMYEELFTEKNHSSSEIKKLINKYSIC